ncbi:hypothetical protein [Cellulomonas sp. PhB143]|uniref:hypothetical protein n=1 Tax=Cellulomonas sp. PhB143 TaxID=2485186 RepID=UPI000F49D3D8|nr:hypothetical protein [Cellulomonas sp. PhB143]ROS79051.1 hypothetical protein EDF32_0097 [Cellulomonas sp. PhB143]
MTRRPPRSPAASLARALPAVLCLTAAATLAACSADDDAGSPAQQLADACADQPGAENMSVAGPTVTVTLAASATKDHDALATCLGDASGIAPSVSQELTGDDSVERLLGPDGISVDAGDWKVGAQMLVDGEPFGEDTLGELTAGTLSLDDVRLRMTYTDVS